MANIKVEDLTVEVQEKEVASKKETSVSTRRELSSLRGEAPAKLPFVRG